MKQADQCDIRIDKDGIWYYRGAEMTRRDIVQHFYQHLNGHPDGSYYIEIDGERCPVQVDDVPYVITSVTMQARSDTVPANFTVSLTDGTEASLDERKPLRVGKDNVLYGWVRGGTIEARFSRAAYYQLGRHIEFDPVEETYRVELEQRSIPIATE